MTFPATEVAERYKTPWVIIGAVKDEITERNFKYVFRINNKAIYDAREQIDAIDLLKKETGKGPQKLAMFYEGSDWGRSHAANVRKLAKERGIRDRDGRGGTAEPGRFLRPAPEDPRREAGRADRSRFYTPDQLLFSRQLLEQRLDLPYGAAFGRRRHGGSVLLQGRLAEGRRLLLRAGGLAGRRSAGREVPGIRGPEKKFKPRSAST